jgi:hypothetical protein
MTIPEARAGLGDPRQEVRDRAARAMRAALSRDARAAADPGEAFWKKKLAAIRPGITKAQFMAETGAIEEGTGGSGQSFTSNFRLDDYWTVSAYFDRPDKLREIGTLARRPRALWVDPPKAFSGKWVTYFVNGSVSHDIAYVNGQYERFTAYHDNGQLAYTQHYVEGKIDGPEVGFHPNGKKAYEGRHAAGKSVGRWVHWYANGNMQSEQTYVDDALDGISMNWREDGTKSSRMDYRAGKETGQAAWDEKGALLYAHGSAEHDAR